MTRLLPILLCVLGFQCTTAQPPPPGVSWAFCADTTRRGDITTEAECEALARSSASEWAMIEAKRNEGHGNIFLRNKADWPGGCFYFTQSPGWTSLSFNKNLAGVGQAAYHGIMRTVCRLPTSAPTATPTAAPTATPTAAPTLAPAAGSPTDPEIVRTGDAPTCKVVNGHTVVNYSPSFHASFKCTHSADACTCTTAHPTSAKGGCKEIDATNGITVQHAGDCVTKDAPTLISGMSPDRATSSASWQARGTYNFDGCTATYNITPRDAFDGNFNTAWDGCCTRFPDHNGGHWLRYDLGEKKTIRAYGFSTGCGECPEDFTMLGSNDGSTWAELDRRTGQRCFHQKHSSYTIAADKKGAYRYLKWTFQTVYGGNQNGVRIHDVALLA